MRLEVPAPGHHTVMQGENWTDLSLTWLGTNDQARTELLAGANKGVPWIPPVEGQEIEIPAVVTYIAGDAETINSIAARFWGAPEPRVGAEQVQSARGRHRPPGRGGPRAGPGSQAHGQRQIRGKGSGRARRREQRDGSGSSSGGGRRPAEAPRRRARYGPVLRAIARANRLLGGGALTHPQLAVVHRALLEAYVAIDALPAAAAACAACVVERTEPGAGSGPRIAVSIRGACSSP